MEGSPRLGPKGLIKKHEFVRILIQCLYSIGYEKSASCLELESGISCKSDDFQLLESQISSGNWDGCVDTLNAIKDLTDDTRAAALFLVFKQCLLEYLSCGDDKLALAILQKEVSALQVDRDKVHNLAWSILSWKEVEQRKIDDNAVRELRKKLLQELEKWLPSPITLPERRLEHLVETAVLSQIDSCMYHNMSDEVSLYADHSCSRDQIPTETVQILTEHKNEVWFVQFSNNGEYLASSSSDCTAIIWKVPEDGRVTLKHTLRSHHNPVSFVAWSPDDSKLLTCGNVEVLKLWDVETVHASIHLGILASLSAHVPGFPTQSDLCVAVPTLKRASTCGIAMAMS
ncbi:WD repeat-containing protein 26 [Prunus yedoensis var. nudiflora]|uniref:WD repeat-containing protein 26 n=1 Tax=Prunus yedoensis var. nudiflora TaxID=2094558 RepID=A0A314ZNI6_PRUYE|nr:WD repeat-containing protein 26 [Prunus yedoensis var. nudiflora]